MSEDVLGQPWEDITSGPITERCQMSAAAFDVEEPLGSCSPPLNMRLCGGAVILTETGCGTFLKGIVYPQTKKNPL